MLRFARVLTIFMILNILSILSQDLVSTLFIVVVEKQIENFSCI